MQNRLDIHNPQARRLVILIIVLNLFVYGLAGLALYQSRVKYEKQAAVSTQNLAHVLEHYISGEIDTIDIALLAVKQRAEEQLAKGKLDRDTLNAFMAQQHSYLPHIQGIRMTNSNGDVIYGTGVTPGITVNNADRDYFKFVRDNPNGELFISQPVFGRIARKWVFNFARRVSNPDGSFAGTVFAALSINHFISSFSEIDVGQKGSILLRDRNFSLLARFPEIPNTIGTKGVTREFKERVQKGINTATFRARPEIDDTERIVTFKKIAQYPLYLFVSRSVDEYLAAWRKELLTYLGFVVLFTVVTIFSSRLLLMKWLQEKLVEAELRQAKDQLEEKVEERTEALNQTNERLINELAFIESLLQNSPAGIRVFDAETGECVLVNQSAADIAGGTVEALLAQNFRSLPSWKTSGLLSLAEQVLADGSVRSMETVLQTSFGKDVPVTYQLSRFDVHQGRLNLLVIGRDISEQKRLSDERKRIEEQMLHAQKLESMGILAGGIAHDFNNILTAIIGNAELALMSLNPESPALENLQRIEKAAGRASDLAKQMLAYSGKGRFVIQSIDANRLLEEMLHMLQVSISKKAVLRLNLHQPLPAVEADATQLRQVIMNLVINASEAIGEKSGVIAISSGCMECDSNYLKNVWLDENLVDGLYVYLEIADTGCGMDKDTMAKIFDPFFTTKFTGRGLGMAAVLGIVRGHKGAIKVYSEPEKGSSFKILLPASHKPEEIFNTGNDNDSWKGSGTVLLVDDEETIRALGSEMLRELGFEVVTAADGREALEIFRQREDVSLVILDLTMPHMDGEQAFRELRQVRPNVNVIISSGYNKQEVTQRFIGKGLAGFIQKPYKLSALREVIKTIC